MNTSALAGNVTYRTAWSPLASSASLLADKRLKVTLAAVLEAHRLAVEAASFASLPASHRAFSLDRLTVPFVQDAIPVGGGHSLASLCAARSYGRDVSLHDLHTARSLTPFPALADRCARESHFIVLS